MKSPYTLTNEELAAYADYHLKYEVDMLLWTTAMLPAVGQVSNGNIVGWAAGNALLESYAIHARNLIDFLYLRDTGRDRPSDIVVQDYVDSSIIARVLPSIPALLDEAKKKADKQVAHLTHDRIHYEKEGKEWRFIDVTTEIMRTFYRIAAYFPESKTTRNFRELISQSSIAIPLVIPSVIRDQDGDSIGVGFQLSKLTSGDTATPQPKG